ncbi:hypothetical protein [Aneurinibacillus migulanus]|uniref:hypothetical protein n=2 Tax=Aneurinibacillus migulanus TaxID=47500 RepID=UPI0005BD87D9|nr:hypothetical protein [Aneurinibacillus migulanus]KIV56770.1 hypothetical protein TS64_08295 [Aneurinibacillus migulanus]
MTGWTAVTGLTAMRGRTTVAGWTAMRRRTAVAGWIAMRGRTAVTGLMAMRRWTTVMGLTVMTRFYHWHCSFLKVFYTIPYYESILTVAINGLLSWKYIISRVLIIQYDPEWIATTPCPKRASVRLPHGSVEGRFLPWPGGTAKHLGRHEEGDSCCPFFCRIAGRIHLPTTLPC